MFIVKTRAPTGGSVFSPLAVGVAARFAALKGNNDFWVCGQRPPTQKSRVLEKWQELLERESNRIQTCFWKARHSRAFQKQVWILFDFQS